VTVLAGNPATSAAILGCINTANATILRRLHPAVAAVVAGVPWADKDTTVADVMLWRAALPAAVGGKVARLPPWAQWGPSTAPVGAALAGVIDLDLPDCPSGVGRLLEHLPRSLRVLRVAGCQGSFDGFRVEHLTSLEVLDCYNNFMTSSSLPPSLQELSLDFCYMSPLADFRHLRALRVLLITYSTDSGSSRKVVDASSIASLPPSLQELNLCGLYPWPAAVSLAHLVQLRVFRATESRIDDATLASLPPCLQELDVADCGTLTRAASFAHLPALQTLTVRRCGIGDASLASLPPRLAYLEASRCSSLTPAAVLPHLPALQMLDVSNTGIGDALIASLPASLTELRMLGCGHVTASATLDHVRALQVLHIHTTGLAPAVADACRARGSTVSAVHVLRGHGGCVEALALLPDGRVASRGRDDNVLLWDPAREGEAPVVLTMSALPTALAVLPDGRRLAVGTKHWSGKVTGCVEVWDAACVPPVRRTTINCGNDVRELALLPGGCLAAGCTDRIVRVDVDAGAVSAVLKGFLRGLQALAVLPDGTLASCDNHDKAVWVWDVDAQACVAKLAGHTKRIRCLMMLPDGRLASGSADRTVRLWDVGARACVGVLSGHGDTVAALTALPDGRLVAAAGRDSILWLWDTRPGAVAASSHPAGSALGVAFARLPGGMRAMAPRPDGCLAYLPTGTTDTDEVRLALLAVPPAPPVGCCCSPCRALPPPPLSRCRFATLAVAGTPRAARAGSLQPGLFAICRCCAAAAVHPAAPQQEDTNPDGARQREAVTRSHNS